MGVYKLHTPERATTQMQISLGQIREFYLWEVIIKEVLDYPNPFIPSAPDDHELNFSQTSTVATSKFSKLFRLFVTLLRGPDDDQLPYVLERITKRFLDDGNSDIVSSYLVDNLKEFVYIISLLKIPSDKVKTILTYLIDRNHNRVDFDPSERFAFESSIISEQNSLSLRTKMGERYKAFLISEGVDCNTASRLAQQFERFCEANSPEFSAINELRAQFHSGDAVPTEKPKFNGVKVDGLASKFLEDNYKREIQDGSLTTNKLQSADSRLHMALYRELLEEGKSLASVISPNGSALERRTLACAKILGTTPEEAAKFFNTVRPDRVRGR